MLLRVEELEYLVTFNWSISQAMQHTMQDFSEGVFISMSNLTLARRDSYLEFIRGGVEPDTAIHTALVLHSHGYMYRVHVLAGYMYRFLHSGYI